MKFYKLWYIHVMECNLAVKYLLLYVAMKLKDVYSLERKLWPT